MLKSHELTETRTTKTQPDIDKALDSLLRTYVKDAGNTPMSLSLEATLDTLRATVRIKRAEVSQILNRLNDARRELGQAQFLLRKHGG